jgi:site-specific DNA-methyltransferase (adenine-specific)
VSDRRRTSTSNFGVSRRESHDASAFYDRFRPPAISEDREIPTPVPISEPFQLGDARSMDAIDDGSVALVITSPPYFAGKQYEEELERDGVPSSYLDYLAMLTDVFAECAKKLEPGGRIAVNVANLGRKPYRSLSADLTRILEHDLSLLLRGEIIWQKAEGASGSCAWGSYRSASNPVIRDLTERIIVASKGRFDRARSVSDRAARGLPHESTISTDDFLSLTLDLWSIPPERARRIGHPAPFPVELPAQLIRLYTFVDDLVLDPFMGSGSTLVAASTLSRRFAGYDLDAHYVELARRRVADEGAPIEHGDEGLSATALAERALIDAGFELIAHDRKLPRSGLAIDFLMRDASGGELCVDVAGQGTHYRGGLSKLDAVIRALGRLTAMKALLGDETRFVIVTTQLPDPRSEAAAVLRAGGPSLLEDVIDLHDESARARLRSLASASSDERVSFWSEHQRGSP